MIYFKILNFALLRNGAIPLKRLNKDVFRCDSCPDVIEQTYRLKHS